MNRHPYPAYKPSGVEWLGVVPEAWSISKLGFHASVKARLGWKGLKADEYVDEGFIFLSTPSIKNRHIDFDAVNYITKERYLESPEIMLEVGDVLIAKDGSTLGTANTVRDLPAPATVNSSIAVLRPKSNLNSSFLYWMMVCHYTQNVIQQVKDGQGVPHLFQADLRQFWIWLPSCEEQRTIAAFLDRETTRLDTLIEKKQRQIELLQEKRTALISHAVTKGLDPNAKMKDSGIEWLGEIPERWEMLAFKRLGEFQGGAGFPDDEQGLLDEELPFYKVSDSNLPGNELFMSAHNNSVSKKTAAKLRAFVFPKDTIVFAKVGAALLLNKRRILTSPACIDNNMMGFIRKSCSLSWVYYWMCSLDLGELANPGAVPSINEGQIREIRVPVPPLTEQRAIASYLDRETAQIDALIEKVEKSIDLLREYRTSLISAAVTGKIDVRKEAT